MGFSRPTDSSEAMYRFMYRLEVCLLYKFILFNKSDKFDKDSFVFVVVRFSLYNI